MLLVIFAKMPASCLAPACLCRPTPSQAASNKSLLPTALPDACKSCQRGLLEQVSQLMCVSGRSSTALSGPVHRCSRRHGTHGSLRRLHTRRSPCTPNIFMKSCVPRVFVHFLFLRHVSLSRRPGSYWRWPVHADLWPEGLGGFWSELSSQMLAFCFRTLARAP